MTIYMRRGQMIDGVFVPAGMAVYGLSGAQEALALQGGDAVALSPSEAGAPAFLTPQQVAAGATGVPGVTAGGALLDRAGGVAAGGGNTVLGPYATIAALNADSAAAVATSQGKVALVGSAAPYTIYDCDGVTWALRDRSQVTSDTAATLGDSILGYGFTAANGTTNQTGTPDSFSSAAYSPRGWFNWANFLLGLPWRWVYFGGVSGERTDEVRARVGNVTAQRPEWVFEFTGRNDISQIATIYGGDATLCENTIVANRQAIWDALLAAGAKVITGPQLANTASLGESSSNKYIALRANARLKAAALSRKNVFWVDVFSEGVDPTDSGGRAVTARMWDSVHPGPELAYRAAKRIVEQVRAFVRPYKGWISSQLDCIQSDSSSKQLLQGSVGLFVSTTGASAGTGVSGTQITAATIARSAGAAATAVASVVASPDGIGNAQRLVCTSTAAGDQFKLSIDIGATLTRVPAGSRVYAELMADISSSTNLTSVAAEVVVTYTGGSPASPTSGSCLLPSDLTKTGSGSDSMTLSLRTAEALLPSGATALTSVVLNVYYNFSGAGGATVDIYRASVLKL